MSPTDYEAVAVLFVTAWITIDRLFGSTPMTEDTGHQYVNRIIGGSLACISLLMAAAIAHLAGAF